MQTKLNAANNRLDPHAGCSLCGVARWNLSFPAMAASYEPMYGHSAGLYTGTLTACKRSSLLQICNRTCLRVSLIANRVEELQAAAAATTAKQAGLEEALAEARERLAMEDGNKVRLLHASNRQGSSSGQSTHGICILLSRWIKAGHIPLRDRHVPPENLLQCWQSRHLVTCTSVTVPVSDVGGA